MTENIPKKMGRYEITAKLGVGSMGVVYKARDPLIGRDVALKTVNLSLPLSEKEEADFHARFLREAQAAGKLNHPNIVQIYDVGRDEDAKVAFIAMEYADGPNLRDFMTAENLFPIEKSLDVLTQLCAALGYAHEHKVIHRDIKPANLLITPAGVLKITDFGIARLPHSQLTQTGQIVGTPYYMAPEQILGGEFDHRVDIFAAGIIFYQLLTGQLPFKGQSMAAVAYQIVNKDPDSPSKFREEIPKEIEAIAFKMLAKNPIERYDRAGDIISDIEAHEKKAGIPPKERLSFDWRALAGKKVHSVVAASVVAMAILAFIAISFISTREKSVFSDSLSDEEISLKSEETALLSEPLADEPKLDEPKPAPPAATPGTPKPRKTEPVAAPAPVEEQKKPKETAEVEITVLHSLQSGFLTVKDGAGEIYLSSENIATDEVKRKVRGLIPKVQSYKWSGNARLSVGADLIKVEIVGEDKDGNYGAEAEFNDLREKDAAYALTIKVNRSKKHGMYIDTEFKKQ